MTVPHQTPVNTSTANGATTVFPYTFRILSQADIEVRVDGVVKTLTTHYTVSGVGVVGGGNVTFLVAPANNAKVVLRRKMALSRTTNYAGDLSSSVLNEDQDAAVLMAQQLQEQADRALTLPVGDSTSSALPAGATLKGKVLAFNETTGAPEAGPSIASVETVAAAAASVATVASHIANVDTVAGSIGNVDAVGSNIGSVVAVDANEANINAAVANEANINTVAGSIADVNATAGSIANVNAVAGNAANINAVAADLSNIDGVAGAIPAINAAPTHAAAAAASEVQAGLSEDNAFAYSQVALAAKAAIEALGTISSQIQIYATKADANTALAGLPNGTFSEVLVDESQSGHRTIYQKTGGVYVFIIDLSRDGKKVYLDTVGGNDANTGLTPDAPVQTFTAANALLQAGDTLRIHGRSRVHKAVNLANKSYISVETYGGYGKAVIDGSRQITGTWTNVAGNLWKITITHEVAPDATNCGFCLWREASTGQPVTYLPKWSAGSQAANQTFVGANAGYFTCNRNGSAAADPRADTFSTSYDYYAYSTTNPNSDGSVWYYAEAQQCFTGFTGGVLRNVIIQRTAHKDMGGLGGLGGGSTSAMVLIEDCEFKEAFMHGWVGGAMIQRRNWAYSRLPGGDYSNAGGGGIHLFRNTDDGYRSFVEDCGAEYFGHNLYSHPGSAGVPSHREIFVKRFASRNSQGMAVSIDAPETRGVHIDGYESYNDAGGIQVPGGSTIKNFRIRLKNPTKAALSYFGTTGGSVACTNGVIVSDSPAPGVLGSNQQASTDSNAAHTCTFSLTNVTAYNVVFNASAFLKQINWTFTDCVLGNLESSWATTSPFLSVTATNSQFGMYRRSLAEIQARSGCAGVAASCLIPWQDQVFTKTIVDATDLRYVSSGVSASFSANDTITFNASKGQGVGDYIQILLYDGVSNHKARLVAGSGVGPYTIDPAVPAFTAGFKGVNVAMFNRKLFPETVSLTAQFSDDGTQAYLSSADYVSVGTVLYFGGIGRRDAIGPRKVTALSGQTVTLDRAVSWELLPSDIVNYPALGVAGNQRPSVACSFKFPLRPVENVSGFPTVMTYTIDHALPVALANSTGFENPSLGATWGTGTSNLQKDNSLWDSQGNKVTYGQIHHEIGEIDCGFAPLGPSDVLTVSTVAYVEDWAPQFASDPRLSGSPALRKGTRLADLAIGSKLV